MVRVSKRHLKQVAKFGVVGVLNTLGDFIIFNVLYGVFHVPLFIANVVAVTVMMSLSLQLNRKYVFSATGRSYSSQAVKFVIVTVLGLYVIQNVILFAVLRSLESMHSSGLLASSIVQANIAKAIGVGGSAVWDFVLYKLWVFGRAPKAGDTDRQEDYL